MVSSCRNSGTISQELRYPFAGTAVQLRQESSQGVGGFESSVISYGSQAIVAGSLSSWQFESSVISYGSQADG